MKRSLLEIGVKKGEVQDPGNGATPYLETDGWTPWQYYASGDELERYHSAANALRKKLERMPPAVRARLKLIEIRCPVEGCLLATVYWMPRRPTAEEIQGHQRLSTLPGANGTPTHSPFSDTGYYLYVGRTAGGTEVYDIVLYGFSETPKDRARPGCTCCRVVYWRAGCRHGTASLVGHDLVEMLAIAGRWRHALHTEEQAVAQLPERLRPFWGKRVFHPEPAAWHPKKRQTRRVRSSPRSQKGAPVLHKGV
jgi:hypothetical protein